MKFKAVASILTTAVIAASYFVPVSAFTVEPDTYEYAPFSEIEFRSVEGDLITIYADGAELGISGSCVEDAEISIAGLDGYTIDEQQGYGSFSADFSRSMTTGTAYFAAFKYFVGDIDYLYADILVTKDDLGNVRFVKPPVYDFNVERCSELWTDDESLQECLQPQNDIECDHPYVIATADEITAGCTNDWEKVFNIYTFITKEFAYDYVQIEDTSMIYQDDAVSLIRRKVAICEGLSNTFVALCRAAGIPAAVSFGIGGTSDEFLNSSTIDKDEAPNHAWAVAYVDGQWYHFDPTWDDGNEYDGDTFATGQWIDGDSYYDYFLLPMEYLSYTHKICDADTVHGIETTDSCGENATYSISRDGVITISGSGTINLPEGVNGFSEIVFAEGSNITTIGEDCFVDCDLITSVILPDTVTRIEDGAFNTCEDLEYIYLPEGLEYIGSEAFDYCDELAYVYVPDSVTTISDWAFDDCPRLIISVPQGMDLGEDDYYVEPYKIIERGS